MGASRATARARPAATDPHLPAAPTSGNAGDEAGGALPGASGLAPDSRLRSGLHQLRVPRAVPGGPSALLGVRPHALRGLLLAPRVDPGGPLLRELLRAGDAPPLVHLGGTYLLGRVGQPFADFLAPLRVGAGSAFITWEASAPARRANWIATGPVGESVASPTPVGRLSRSPASRA
jgi:hypothetical protein